MAILPGNKNSGLMFTECSGSLPSQKPCGGWFMSLFKLEIILSTNRRLYQPTDQQINEKYKVTFRNLGKALEYQRKFRETERPRRFKFL